MGGHVFEPQETHVCAPVIAGGAQLSNPSLEKRPEYCVITIPMTIPNISGKIIDFKFNTRITAFLEYV
jgi:hypothetical protein